MAIIKILGMLLPPTVLGMLSEEKKQLAERMQALGEATNLEWEPGSQTNLVLMLLNLDSKVEDLEAIISTIESQAKIERDQPYKVSLTPKVEEPSNGQ